MSYLPHRSAPSMWRYKVGVVRMTRVLYILARYPPLVASCFLFLLSLMCAGTWAPSPDSVQTFCRSERQYQCWATALDLSGTRFDLSFYCHEIPKPSYAEGCTTDDAWRPAFAQLELCEEVGYNIHGQIIKCDFVGQKMNPFRQSLHWQCFTCWGGAVRLQ